VAQVQLNRHKYTLSHHRTRREYCRKLVSCRCTATLQEATFGRDTFPLKNFPCCKACKGTRPPGNCWTPPRLRTTGVNKKGAVSHRIGEGHWRSSSQPTPFITFWQVLRNNSWRSNKQWKKKR